MPIVELHSTDFTRTFSGGGSLFSDVERTIYIVDSILPGSVSGTGSLKITWTDDVLVKWKVGRPPRNFGSNVRIGIAVKYINFSGVANTSATAGIFIRDVSSSGISAGIRVGKNPSGNIYFSIVSPYGSFFFTPQYFEQIILRQEVGCFLFHYSFSDQNTKSLVNTSTFNIPPASGGVGFFLSTSLGTSGTVLFDYFFVEEYIGA